MGPRGLEEAKDDDFDRKLTQMGAGIARDPRSEVRGRGPKTGHNRFHPVFLLGWVVFAGRRSENPICVNLRSFAVVGGLKMGIFSRKTGIFHENRKG